MHTHKFESEEAAEAYFNSKGKLKYFGRSGGVESLYGVYNWHRWDGKRFHVNIGRDGFVEVEEFSPMQYDVWKGE
jgi:hypothetical protein